MNVDLDILRPSTMREMLDDATEAVADIESGNDSATVVQWENARYMVRDLTAALLIHGEDRAVAAHRMATS